MYASPVLRLLCVLLVALCYGSEAEGVETVRRGVPVVSDHYGSLENPSRSYPRRDGYVHGLVEAGPPAPQCAYVRCSSPGQWPTPTRGPRPQSSLGIQTRQRSLWRGLRVQDVGDVVPSRHRSTRLPS